MVSQWIELSSRTPGTQAGKILISVKFAPNDRKINALPHSPSRSLSRTKSGSDSPKVPPRPPEHLADRSKRSVSPSEFEMHNDEEPKVLEVNQLMHEDSNQPDSLIGSALLGTYGIVKWTAQISTGVVASTYNGFKWITPSVFHRYGMKFVTKL